MLSSGPKGWDEEGIPRYVVLGLLLLSSAKFTVLSVCISHARISSTHPPLLRIRPYPTLPFTNLLNKLPIKKSQRRIRRRYLHLEPLFRIIEQRLDDEWYLDACDAAGGEEEDMVGAWPSV